MRRFLNGIYRDRRRLLPALLLPVLILAAASGIQCTPAATSTSTEIRPGDIDPQAEQALKRMCECLGEAKAFGLHVDAILDKPIATGQYAQFHRGSDITAVRPNRLHVVTNSDDGAWTVWYSGKTLTILDREDNEYATETVPDHMDEMLDHMADQYHLVMPMADLLVGETYKSLLAHVTSADYLGLHTVDGVKCHHLLFKQDTIDWQIWIAADGQPTPRKMVITRKLEPGQPQYVAVMSGWDLSPKTPDDLFTFKAPANAKSTTMADLVASDDNEDEDGSESE